jgi:hypothetical protein
MIADLDEMSKADQFLSYPLYSVSSCTQSILTLYMRYRAAVEKKTGPSAAPKRIIFYRG